ncbi:MAG TPA: trypsin-like peptidase domain-containing protein [Ardenticatenaceae bacterium]|nr:trypsin-like peptidase domain-containing protein [Ardenticatenaceae bacterium]
MRRFVLLAGLVFSGCFAVALAALVVALPRTGFALAPAAARVTEATPASEVPGTFGSAGHLDGAASESAGHLEDPLALLEAEEAWLEALYQTASPSVVNITSRSYSYDFFFNVVPQEGTGSGFIWDGEGRIVTNYHVVEEAQELEVKLADGSQLPATVVGADPANDLAVIQLEELPASPLVPLELGDSEELRVGQRVVAIGNPFGFERTLTTGIVSALGRVIQSETGDFIGEVVQTDAAINPGNSGGPLLDVDGRVIGVNTQIFSPSGASAGIGFAIPASVVRRVVPELVARGHYPHPWLGIEGFDLTPGMAERLRGGGIEVGAGQGILVLGVYRGGPAEGTLRGGQQQVRVGNLILPVGGDLIVALDGQPIASQREMMMYLESNKWVGDAVRVTLFRGTESMEVTLTLSERPERR